MYKWNWDTIITVSIWVLVGVVVVVGLVGGWLYILEKVPGA